MKRIICWFLVFALTIGISAREYSINDVPNVQLQDRTRHLVNPDGIISPAVAAQIDSLLLDARRIASAEVVAVVLDDINNDDIDWFATDLFNTWGIGKKDKNNGILLLVAMQKRALTIRTGYGAEGILPDIICGRIINNIIIPHFKGGDYEGGVLAGVNEIHRLVTDPQAVEELMSQLKDNYPDDDTSPLMKLGMIALMVAIIIFLIKLMDIAGRVKCPKCQHDMRCVRREVTREATLLHDGEEILYYVCDNCGSQFKKRRNIPKKMPPIIYGGGHSSFGSGFGGRSFGGGFGGGRTGGGGASGRW